MEVMIRTAQKGDLPDLLNLYAQSGLNEGPTLPLAEAEAIFDRMQRYPDYQLCLAERDGQLVGAVALLIMDNLCHGGAPSGVVEDVAVHPAWCRRGIGTAMMRFAMARCREAGCYKLTLSANLRRDQAHAFYESLGFQKHGHSFWANPHAGLPYVHPAGEMSAPPGTI